MLIGIGPGNRLYWDGKPVEMRRSVSLTWFQGLLATTGAVGAFAAGVIAFLQYFFLHLPQ